jgi:signal transduction histidine kinase
MKIIWNYISNLGLNKIQQNFVKREIVMANRINFVITVMLLVLTLITTLIRGYDQGNISVQMRFMLLLVALSVVNFYFSYKGLFLQAKTNLVFTPLLIVVLLPVFAGSVNQIDFIYGPIIIISLSLLPQLVLNQQKERYFYFSALFIYLIVVALYDNLLIYFSPGPLPITDIAVNFQIYYKIIFISGFLFLHASIYYLRELAGKYEKELSETNKILENQKNEISDKNEELSQQHEEILAQTHELETINRHLEDRVVEELSKNRKKDMMMVQQSRQAAMGEMIGNIAHQWRQPLSAVAVIVQNIQESYSYNELTKENLNSKVVQCMQLIEYMSHTIDDFRNFFKPEKSITDFNLREAVEKSISFVKETLKANNINLEFHASEDIIVTGFPNEYSQVILNLINNAKDILLERKVKNPRIEITLFRKEERSYLYVADNGGGIAPDIKDKIFTPYFTTKEQGVGTGIGLYMSKTIIEKNMGGNLSFMDIEGGTEFCVVL